MKQINIDIETFSSVNLAKSGVYKYAESEDFEVLLFAYSVDYGEAHIVDLTSGETIPKDIMDALKDDSILKWAFNAQFERICLSKLLGLPQGEYLNPVSWRCTMIWSASMGLPLSLEGVGTVLGLEKQKLTQGKELIRYFCVPCTPTQTNGMRTRNLPVHDRDKWRDFRQYNIRDVEVEMEIAKKLSKFPVSDALWQEYHLDQTINDRGILVDTDFVNQAIDINDKVREKLMHEISYLTGLENPNSIMQLRQWLSENGVETESLDKKAVKELLKTVNHNTATVLKIRQQLSKSSVRKYQAMVDVACLDQRCRGMFQFLGANRTGRFSGRLVQLQNLPQNHISDLKEARSLVKTGNMEALGFLYDDTPNLLSQLIRTAFIPKNNQLFYVADFSAIEARVIAWLAKEKWRLSVFKEGGDIYCASASQMFGVPVEKHGVNSELRQKGKIAELALGYGGSVGALTAMGALEMGLSEEELKPLVNAWRSSNPMIVDLWWSVDRCAKQTVKERVTTKTHGISFSYQSGILFITLPSGRKLSYIKPRIGENQFGGESVTYEGVGTTKKWERIESYGPKFVENIVQAIARDILVYAMKNLSAYDIVAHVHDEVIIEAKSDTKIEDVCQVMGIVPPWAKGLPLDADGYICEFYKKE
ncbi:DNA polymerase [Aerococcaceae bacterium NML191219]|nr:DNA polymerase [Aerococcaceae bacterium NML191219]